MKILYLDPDLNNLLDIAYNPGMAKEVKTFCVIYIYSSQPQ